MEAEKTGGGTGGNEPGNGELAVMDSTAANAESDFSGAVSYVRQRFEVPIESPIEERINHLYHAAISLAQNSAAMLIEAGRLLRDKHSDIKKKGKVGTIFDVWVQNNCPKISRTTSYRMMAAASFYDATKGNYELTTIRQLYIAAEILKDNAKNASSDPKSIDSILEPIQRILDRFKTAFDYESILALNPIAAPQLLGYIDDVRKELDRTEVTVIKKFGNKRAMIEV